MKRQNYSIQKTVAEIVSLYIREKIKRGLGLS